MKVIIYSTACQTPHNHMHRLMTHDVCHTQCTDVGVRPTLHAAYEALQDARERETREGDALSDLLMIGVDRFDANLKPCCLQVDQSTYSLRLFSSSALSSQSHPA